MLRTNSSYVCDSDIDNTVNNGMSLNPEFCPVLGFGWKQQFRTTGARNQDRRIERDHTQIRGIQRTLSMNRNSESMTRE